jgi:hypothetical protein
MILRSTSVDCFMVERGLSVYLLVLQGCVGEEVLEADEEGKEGDEKIKDKCLCMPKGGWTGKGLGGGDTGGQGDKSRVAGLVAGKKCLVAWS